MIFSCSGVGLHSALVVFAGLLNSLRMCRTRGRFFCPRERIFLRVVLRVDLQLSHIDHLAASDEAN